MGDFPHSDSNQNIKPFETWAVFILYSNSFAKVCFIEIP